MNREIRVAILAAGYDRHYDFADAVGMKPPDLSSVLCNRKKLTREQSETWRAVLKCRPILLKKVTMTN